LSRQARRASLLRHAEPLRQVAARAGLLHLRDPRSMTNEELRALNKTRQIQQIAWLTRDLEKSMQAWIDILRIGPWRVFRFTDKTVKNLKVGGKPVEDPFE